MIISLEFSCKELEAALIQNDLKELICHKLCEKYEISSTAFGMILEDEILRAVAKTLTVDRKLEFQPSGIGWKMKFEGDPDFIKERTKYVLGGSPANYLISGPIPLKEETKELKPETWRDRGSLL